MSADPARRSPSSDKLRAAIDRGETGDKVPCPDPAAVPLGTDDEAAGPPPSDPALDITFASETRRPVRKTRGDAHWIPIVVAAVAFVAAITIVLAAATA